MTTKETITYTSENGYTGILYGSRSISIQDKNGVEMFHSGFRSIETYEELKDFVERFPEFYKTLSNL